MTRRRLFVLIHRCTGLLLAGFLTIVGITGAALVWKVQLERTFAPQLFVLKAHAPGTRRADPLFVRRQVEQAYPWAYVDVADLSSAADAPLEFSLTPRSPLNALKYDDDAFADPITGEVLGSRHYGDLQQGIVNLLPFIYRLHEELVLGNFGTTCLGVVAMLWTLDAFIGMYLSFPANQRESGQSRSQRFAAWPGRFWPSLKIRWQAGGFRRIYDLHRASGVWLWLLLLVFSWSGVAFNLPLVYQSIMHVFGGSPGRTADSAGCGSNPLGDSSSSPGDRWPENLAVARRLMRNEAQSRHFRILAERFLAYDRERCEWMYRVRSTLDVDSIGNTQLIWPGSRDRQAVFSAPTGVSRADTFTTWIEAIHEAQTGGLPMRWLVCGAGLATAGLSITGVLIFLRKMGIARPTRLN